MTTIYTVNNKVLKNSANDKWLTKKAVDPYNPLGLPPNTVRVRTSDGNAPIKGTYTSYETATLVSGTTDVYDVYKSGTNFLYFLRNSTNVSEVLGANTTGVITMQDAFSSCSSLTSVALFDTSSATNIANMFSSCALTSVPLFNTSSATNMSGMFYNCTSLTSVPLFNTSNVTNTNSMFMSCSALTSVPLLDTSKVTIMTSMFKYCRNVQSGALSLYQQASSQTTPPTSHGSVFTDCGSNTTTGAAELAQIPSSWGGTGA